MNIKKGDNILVIAGRDKGKQGIVEKAIPTSSKVVVAGVNLHTRHMKKTQANPQGGIITKPSPFQRANVMVVCPHCNQPTRIKIQVADNSKKYRYCSKCQTSLDSK